MFDQDNISSFFETVFFIPGCSTDKNTQICIHMYTIECVPMCTHLHTHKHTHSHHAMYMYSHRTHAHIQTYTHTCRQIYPQVHIHTYIPFTDTYVHTFIYAHTYILAHILIHTILSVGNDSFFKLLETDYFRSVILPLP